MTCTKHRDLTRQGLDKAAILRISTANRKSKAKRRWHSCSNYKNLKAVHLHSSVKEIFAQSYDDAAWRNVISRKHNRALSREKQKKSRNTCERVRLLTILKKGFFDWLQKTTRRNFHKIGLFCTRGGEIMTNTSFIICRRGNKESARERVRAFFLFLATHNFLYKTCKFTERKIITSRNVISAWHVLC